MALNTCETSSNGIKVAFFPKNYKNLSSGWELPSDHRLWYAWIALVYFIFLPLKIFLLFNFWFKPSSFAKILVKSQTRPMLLILHCTISLPHKKFLFRKFLMTSCMWFVICPPPPTPQSKILATPIFQRGNLCYYHEWFLLLYLSESRHFDDFKKR